MDANDEGIAVDPSNQDAFQAWDGDDGAYWAEHHDRFDAGLVGYHARLLDAAAIAPGEHVLDIGCGNGQTTREAARRSGTGRALGVDLSSRMLAVARERAAEQGIANVEFVQGDAQVHPFDPGAFDLAISRFGAMFFGDPVAAFTNIGRALRPDARLVLLVWQALDRNPWVADVREAVAVGRDLPTPPPGAPGPFSLADPDRARSLLEAAGFAEVDCQSVEAPVSHGRDADAAFTFVSNQGLTRFLMQGLDDDGRARALAALRASLEAHAGADGVRYDSAAWLVRARRS